MSTIDAKLRLTAQFDQALAALGQLRGQLAAMSGEMRNAGGGAAAQQVGQGLQAAGRQAEAATAKTEALGASVQRVATGAQQAQAVMARMAQLGGNTLRAISAEAQGFGQRVAAAATAADQAGEKTSGAGRKGARGVKEAGDQAVRSVQLTQRQLAQLSPQLTDIFVSLSSGQSPLMVLIQQGGQIKDLFGGFGGAFRALATLVTPLTAVATAVAAIATAAALGYRESSRLDKAMALTGVSAATSAGQLQQWANQMQAAGQASRSASLEALQTAASSAVFQGSTIKAVADAAAAMAKVSDKAAADWVADFQAMGDGVAAWALKANRSYAFLSAEQFRQIRALESQGRRQEAMRLVMEQLNGTITQRSVPAIGSLERGWNAVTRAVSNAWEAMKRIGRVDTQAEALAQLQAKVDELRKTREEFATGIFKNDFNAASQVQRLDAQLKPLEAQLERLRTQFNRDALRESERNSAAAAAQAAMLEQERDFQEALNGAGEAGLRQRLAGTQAAIAQQQQALEQQHAQGLLAEERYIEQRAALELRALQAEAAAIKARRDKVAKAEPGTPDQQRGKTERLAELEAELATVGQRMQAAQAQLQGGLDAATLSASRERAQAWADTWSRAAESIRSLAQRNAETAAAAIADPFERASAVAEAAVAEERRRLQELERDLRLQIELSIDEGSRNALQEQLAELGRTAATRLNDTLRSARLDALRQAFAAATAAVALEEERLAQAVESGALGTEQAEQRKFAARAKALPQLRALIETMRELARSAGDQGEVDRLGLVLDKLGQKSDELQKTLRASVGSSFSQLFTDVATGAERADKAFGKFLVNIAKSVLDLIARKLGEQLVESLFSSGQSSGGGGWMAALGQIFASMFHSGGVVGQGGAGRTVSPLAFLAAPRYHSGGIAGLRPREVPAVLMQGEEVLTEDDPRHISNIGRGKAVGDVNISVSVTGAQGEAGSLNAAGGQLAQMIRAVVSDWAIDQQRQGGILAGVRR